MKLKEILAAFDEFAPFSLQESYDNSGIQYGDPSRDVQHGVICLDVTEAMVDEAILHGCDLIISHHPLIFGGIKKLTGAHYTERALIKAIKNDISIISVHTNIDSVWQGVSERLAIKIGIEEPSVLDARKGLLKKLVIFCPTEKAEQVRQAIFAAGAGHIGDYDCCSFNLDGSGTFRAGEGTDPYVGKKERSIRKEK
jgi:putative NIF3 family GTP cyclohydrolase 1 type 2